MEELDEYLSLIKPFFSSIEGKSVLEYACFAGDWWKMFALHSPKNVIAFDPVNYNELYNDDLLQRNLQMYCDLVEHHHIGYEDFKSPECDVIVCAGLLYKLSSPFNLIENIANKNPDIIFFETTGHIGDGDSISILKYGDDVHHRDLNRNFNTRRLPWVVQITPDTVVQAFDKLGYKLEDHINISCKSRPSKERVAMMRFKKK